MSDKLILQCKQYDFDAGIHREFEDYTQYNKEHDKLLKEVKAHFPESGKYVGSVLHDSRVLSVDYQKNDYFNIQINDIRYVDFCWALQKLEKIKIPFRNKEFPVVLKFSGLKKCRAHWCNKNNKLLPLKTEKYAPKIDEYLYDEIHAVDGSYINLVLHLCTTMWRTQKYNLILHIIAERFSVIEKQQDVLKGILDKKYYPLLESLEKAINESQVFDTPAAEEFIKTNRHLITD